MGALYIGLSAVGWHVMVGTWWEKLLAGFLLATIVLGLSYIMFRITHGLIRFWQRKQKFPKRSAAVQKYLKRVQEETAPLSSRDATTQESKSFGVYLGGFSNRPSQTERNVLSRWDILVVDPGAAGVFEALSCNESSSIHKIGRLNVQALAGTEKATGDDEVIRSLGIICQALETRFRHAGADSPYTGVLLAEFVMHFPPIVVTGLAKFINGLGLDLWLELSPPSYLAKEQSADLNMAHIRGVIYRNATIRRDGNRQNFFHMADIRTTQRAIAAQKVKSPPLSLVWETVDNGVKFDYAVVKRCYDWCNYNSALCWIGAESSLMDVSSDASIRDKPLGALLFLRQDGVTQAHEFWSGNNDIRRETTDLDDLYRSLEEFIPNLSEKLKQTPQKRKSRIVDNRVVSSDQSPVAKFLNPLSYSDSGRSLTGLGSFHIGLEAVNSQSFSTILHTQRNLKDLNLLKLIEGADLRDVEDRIRAALDAESSHKIYQRVTAGVREFLTLLNTYDAESQCQIQIYSGLHSGFQTSSGVQYWGLYDVDALTGCLNIYISNKTPDRAATILHTFLSSRNYARHECFLAEVAMYEATERLCENRKLPPSIASDIRGLSPAEILSFIQRLSGYENDILISRIKTYCEYQLIDLPTLTQLRALSSTEYLGGRISAEELVTKRLDWLEAKGCWLPDRNAAVELFEEIDARLYEVLMLGQSEIFATLTNVIQAIAQQGRIDASSDIFSLALFCAFRKLALDEVYLEVMDRNPYPNHATDQAGCFAEHFALGSRCESFFDATPRNVGRIISDRYRNYYTKHQPPRRPEVFTDLPTTYASMQADADPSDGKEQLSPVYKVSFLAIFALPALFDIMLLTTIGRGLYLTTFMSDTNKFMATTALMIALIMCGAVGSWITSGGSYYLYANAFPAMSMFVLTRFTVGLGIVLAVGLPCMVAFMFKFNVIAGLVFFYYFSMLTTYLLTLSALSIYQVPGTSFLSGRTVIMTCIPMLFISPIVTIWVHHDLAVYLSVLTVFLGSLLAGARRTIAKWNTFYLDIPSVTDAEVLHWYEKHAKIRKSASNDIKNMEEIAGGPRARDALHTAVMKEANRNFWQFSCGDPLVVKLARGYPSTRFLMAWYCNFKRSAMPLPYSPTWNLTLKAGLEMMTNMQKGLRLHSAFLHWRRTGEDVLSGLLYFVVALMDKWVGLVIGENLVGLSAASSPEFRLAVGFGLTYYLIGAVSLDYVSQPLWTAAHQKTVQPITSLEFLKEATVNDSHARRRLYWKSLAKFFFLHIWGMTITAALMWSFESARSAVGLYLTYVTAYSGLLWYQFNKIFCGSAAAKSLAIAALFGFPVGVTLHETMPHFAYSGVISVLVATWVAAIHSMWTSGVFAEMFKNAIVEKLHDELDSDTENDFNHFSGITIEPYPELSQNTWSKKYMDYSDNLDDDHYRLDPKQYPGSRVIDYLLTRSTDEKPEIIRKAFPNAAHYLQKTVELWEAGETLVDLVTVQRPLPHQEQYRAVVRVNQGKVHILVICDGEYLRSNIDSGVESNITVISEALVQATCEHHLGMMHEHAALAEILATESTEQDTISIPEGVKRQLDASTIDRERFIKGKIQTLLKYRLLGIDCETEWDLLPKSIRSFLLDRALGIERPLSEQQEDWLRSRMPSNDMIEPSEYLHRCQLGTELTMVQLEFGEEIEARGYSSENASLSRSSVPHSFSTPEQYNDDETPSRTPSVIFSQILQSFRTCIKFICISMTADTDFQRELDYTMKKQPRLVRMISFLVLNSIWNFYKTLQRFILPAVLLHDREKVSNLYEMMQQNKSTILKNRILFENVNGHTTCFLKTQEDKTIQLYQYIGQHEKEPGDASKLISINFYTDKLRLIRREERKDNEIINVFSYEYGEPKEGLRAKFTRTSSSLPLHRQCIEGQRMGHIDRYDQRGYISNGTRFEGVNPVEFTLWYRNNAEFEDELLRGEFVFPHITMRVNWSMPPRDSSHDLSEWIPFSKVSEATFIEGSDVYHASWAYEHKFHPEITTTLNGELIRTPEMIAEDWFHILKKPSGCSFASDNPLLGFSLARSSTLLRVLGLNKIYKPAPTSYARTQLWKTWKTDKYLDAVTARWLDEKALRSDKILAPYWKARDWGNFEVARNYLDSQADTIMARTDLDAEISSWVNIAYKISDYYAFGQGGESTINTRSAEKQIKDSDEELHILAMDTSTWPQDPGGVSACRRDMVNDLRTIKWHVIAESANDYGVPKFQIERNVQSITMLPLWGLDFLNPCHGLLENNLDSAIVERSYLTTDEDVRQNFLPILTSLVRCSRPTQITRLHIEEATNALVDLNTYFETTRNWNDVWNHEIVKQKWRELWLTEVDGTTSISQWWDFEKPTIEHLDQALNMWHRYLFIFSVALPEKIPDVFQASHHFTGATYGILCKVKRNCTLHVWDHCVSFRELTTFLSSAVSFDSPFVNSSLMSLGHLSCVLLEHHADVVLPCCGYFNPGWEVELGSAEGALEHRRTFARKIDPVVNGICNMEKFEPIKTIKTSKPTVVMLSHVQYVKDIKNAIMAADIIVNKWGFMDYTLHIYGDMERSAGYSTECQALIAAKGLGDRCVLKGLGNPSLVLQDAWLFLNSSISEGLPLAMGEAALTGVPVVCTDVGASFCVVTDSKTGDRFSEVVSPNDCESLARAQINVLALLGNWSSFAEDTDGVEAPVLGYPHPSPDQVSAITKRMYSKTEQRRALGMLGRENVLKNFSSERYLREHEQMLWVGKYRSRSYQSRVARPSTPGDTAICFAKEASSIRSQVPAWSPRLSPESWVALSSGLTSSSTLSTTPSSSIFSWFTEKSVRPKLQSRWVGGDIIKTTRIVDEETGTATDSVVRIPAAVMPRVIIRSDDEVLPPGVEESDIDATLSIAKSLMAGRNNGLHSKVAGQEIDGTLANLRRQADVARVITT